MARGVNKVILIGNLGADPETRYMPSGGGVTNTRVATTETWRDKQSGDRQERTEWHRVVFFNKLSDIASQYLRKGSRVYVEGSIRTRKWQGQDGQDRYTTEIVASEMQMLDGRSDSVPASTGPESDWDQSPPPAQGQKSGGSKPAATNQPPADDFDDDIPF